LSVVVRVDTGPVTYQEIETIIAFDVESPPDHIPVHVGRNTPHDAAIEEERDATGRVAFVKVGILLGEIVEAVFGSAGEAPGDAPCGALWGER
jgi:hypothetical protein